MVYDYIVIGSGFGYGFLSGHAERGQQNEDGVEK